MYLGHSFILQMKSNLTTMNHSIKTIGIILISVVILFAGCKDKPPECTILDPADNEAFEEGEEIFIQASAFGTGSKETVTIDLYVDNVKITTTMGISITEVFDPKDLNFGSHTIKVVATDSKGQVAMDEVTILYSEYVPPIPPFQSGFTADVDGAGFGSLSAFISVTSTGIYGQDASGTLSIDFADDSVGEYVIDSTNNGNAGFYSSFSAQNSWDTDGAGGIGKIIISAKTDTTLIGTFYFTATSENDSSTISVTNGVFQVKI